MNVRDRLVVEDRICRGGARFAANPCLDGCESFGGLMDIIEIREVADRRQELADTIVPIAERGYRKFRTVKIETYIFHTEPFGHDHPRSTAKHAGVFPSTHKPKGKLLKLLIRMQRNLTTIYLHAIDSKSNSHA